MNDPLTMANHFPTAYRKTVTFKRTFQHYIDTFEGPGFIKTGTGTDTELQYDSDWSYIPYDHMRSAMTDANRRLLQTCQAFKPISYGFTLKNLVPLSNCITGSTGVQLVTTPNTTPYAMIYKDIDKHLLIRGDYGTVIPNNGMLLNIGKRTLTTLKPTHWEATQQLLQFTATVYGVVNNQTIESAATFFTTEYKDRVIQPMDWNGWSTLPVGTEYSYTHKATQTQYNQAPINEFRTTATAEDTYWDINYQIEGSRYSCRHQASQNNLATDNPFSSPAGQNRRTPNQPYIQNPNNTPPYIIIKPSPIYNVCDADKQQVSFQCLIQYHATYELIWDGSANYFTDNWRPQPPAVTDPPTESMLAPSTFTTTNTVNHGRTYYNVNNDPGESWT